MAVPCLSLSLGQVKCTKYLCLDHFFSILFISPISCTFFPRVEVGLLACFRSFFRSARVFVIRIPLCHFTLSWLWDGVCVCFVLIAVLYANCANQWTLPDTPSPASLSCYLSPLNMLHHCCSFKLLLSFLCLLQPSELEHRRDGWMDGYMLLRAHTEEDAPSLC